MQCNARSERHVVENFVRTLLILCERTRTRTPTKTNSSTSTSTQSKRYFIHTALHFPFRRLSEPFAVVFVCWHGVLIHFHGFICVFTHFNGIFILRILHCLWNSASEKLHCLALPCIALPCRAFQGKRLKPPASFIWSACLDFNCRRFLYCYCCCCNHHRRRRRRRWHRQQLRLRLWIWLQTNYEGGFREISTFNS